MPQTKERKKEYMREYMKEKRSREREAEVREQVEMGNINYTGTRPRREQFMTFDSFKRHFPNASFPTYLKEKREFESVNRMEPVPKMKREEAFKLEGVDFWHQDEREKGKQQAIREHHRQADRLTEFLNSPEHPNRPTERTNWQEEIKEQEQSFRNQPEKEPTLPQEEVEGYESHLMQRSKRRPVIEEEEPIEEDPDEAIMEEENEFLAEEEAENSETDSEN